MLPPCVGSVGPKNCARTHHTDFGRRQTNVRSAHVLEELAVYFSSYQQYIKRRNRNKDIRNKSIYRKCKQSSAYLPVWISVTLITLIILSGSCCYENIHVFVVFCTIFLTYFSLIDCNLLYITCTILSYMVQLRKVMMRRCALSSNAYLMQD